MRPTRLQATGLLALAVAFLPGCHTTGSTEVGVRTNLLGILEKRGDQQVYSPGGVYLVLPVVNAWTSLPVSQQNLLMNSDPTDGDRPVPDDISFKTRDGNNVFIDVNVMWRVDPQKAGFIVQHVGQSIEEIKERVVRPISRSVIRDVFNEITSEEYYQVTVKNRVAGQAKDALAAALAPFGVVVDMLQVQQHRFDQEYQAAINAQKQAEADVQTLFEKQKNAVVQKQSELEARRSEWNGRVEEARGEAGRIRNDADGYYQTQTNGAKAILAQAQAQADGVRKSRGPGQAGRRRLREDPGRQGLRHQADLHRARHQRVHHERERDAGLPARAAAGRPRPGTRLEGNGALTRTAPRTDAPDGLRRAAGHGSFFAMAVRPAVPAVALLLLAGVCLAGCSTTRYYERQKLADRAMAFDADRQVLYLRDKIEAAREGGLGGYGGAAAGGCGCE